MLFKSCFTAMLALPALSACVVAPPPQPLPVTLSVTRPPVQEAYFYPAQGQSPAQVDRDRFECHEWAVKQSNYDPSLPQPATAVRAAHVVDTAPVRDTAVGAVAGAAIGAAVSEPWRAGQGAAIGAVAGALIGATGDAARSEAIQQANAANDARAQQRVSAQGAGYDNYRRALNACGSGRGYEVR